MSQSWPLSAEANKKKGVCSVCFATRQLHLKDGTVHKHGPRDNPCLGSHKLPLSNTDIPGTPAVDVGAASISQPHSLAVGAQPPTGNEPPSAYWNPHPIPIIKHIPKSARPACATHLAHLFRQVAAHPDVEQHWLAIINWARQVLCSPKRGGKRHNVANVIKKRIDKLDDSSISEPPLASDTCNAVGGNKRQHYSLREAISAKMEDGNIRAAVRLLCSDEHPAEFSASTLNQLRQKHPPAPPDRLPIPPKPPTSLVVDEAEVARVVRTFPAGSAGGPDGFRPQHFLDLIRCRESGPELLSALTGVVNLLLSGKCHPAIIPVLFGGRLIALSKKSGGVRPIAVGFTLRRLCSKCANAFAISELLQYFGSRQLGAGIKGGCEAAVHSARRFLKALPENWVMAKLDFSNAFNCVRRDAMLNAVFEHIPGIYNYCHLAYNLSSFLWFGEDTIMSEEGAQQGDPLGPLLFCLTVHPLLSSLQSPFAAGYLDDFTIGGSESVVAHDINTVFVKGAELGLRPNVSKCELICHSEFTPASLLLRSFIKVTPDESLLLGVPILPAGRLDSVLQDCCSELSRAIDRLQSIESHDALIILRVCLGAPKIQYLLRCTPCFDHSILSTNSFARV